VKSQIKNGGPGAFFDFLNFLSVNFVNKRQRSDSNLISNFIVQLIASSISFRRLFSVHRIREKRVYISFPRTTKNSRGSVKWARFCVRMRPSRVGIENRP